MDFSKKEESFLMNGERVDEGALVDLIYCGVEKAVT